MPVLTSVVTGLSVLAAAASTMDATREPPVYMTTSESQQQIERKACQQTMIPLKLQNL